MMMTETATLSSLALFYMAHMLLSALISIGASFFLRKRYQDKFFSVFILVLFFNITVPLIGYFFTFWMTYYLLQVRYEKTLKNTKVLNMQELDHEFPTVKRMFGEGSMKELMSNEDAPKHKRMKALSAIAEDMNKKNIALIKHSLADKDDEIRLFSFSLMDKMEQNINTKIHQASIRFEKEEEPDEKAKAAKELAYLYWDMIYFDLSDDTLRSFLLNESLKYARMVFDHDMTDSSMNVLLGKIFLAQKDYDEASTQFVMAIESGMRSEYIIPYLAELYFERGNYRSIRSMLNLVQGLGINSTLYPVIEQWKHHA